MSFMPPNPETLPTRERLLWAALVCFSRKGYHQTTTDEIVAESGMGKGTLYRYFATKQDLFISLVEWAMLKLGEDMAEIDPEGLSAGELLKAGVEKMMLDAEQLLPFYRITLDFWAQTTEDAQIRRMFVETLQQFQAQLVPTIEAGIAAGEFRPVDAGQAAYGLMAMLDGVGLYKALLEDEFDLHGSVATTVDIFLAGLRSQ